MGVGLLASGGVLVLVFLLAVIWVLDGGRLSLLVSQKHGLRLWGAALR
jgi:hypothetical protein